MTTVTAAKLDEAASRDAAVAPLARLQAEALRALTSDPAWRAAAASVDLTTVPVDRPLLHGARVTLDPGAARSLLDRLAVLDPEGGALDEVDALALIEASVTQRGPELDALAAVARSEPSRLAAIAQVAAWPLLLALGERARGVLPAVRWERGYCPTCSAWPLLAELRGLERERVLRCGRCGGGWTFRHLTCAFCGNDDHRTLTYLASESERETRRAQVCGRCHGYLKGLATLRTFDTEALALADLWSLDLDLAAIELGYGRPSEPAFALDLDIQPA